MKTGTPLLRLFLFLAFLVVVSGLGSAQDRTVSSPTPVQTPRPEPIQLEPVPKGFRRVTSEPTPSPTPTPFRTPHLLAALESEEDQDFERVALFDDGTLMRIQRYKGRGVPRFKQLTSSEVDLVRCVVREALLVPVPASPERSVADLHGRRIRMEIADEDGRSRLFATEELTALPLAVGRAKAALEDLRDRFFKSDPKETDWDPSRVKTGDLLRHRIEGTWYRVVRDDAFEASLELEEVSEIGARMLIARGQLPSLFESPAAAGPTPTPPGRR